MSEGIEEPTLTETKNQSEIDIAFSDMLEEYFSNNPGSSVEKLKNFSKYVSRQDLTNFVAKYEIFKQILEVQGSVVECGVFQGNGLMTWAKLSSIFEPYNHQRKIIGFDTFCGIPSVAEEDKMSKSEHAHVGKLSSKSYDDLVQCIKLYDMNRALAHITKVSLVKGNMVQTIPRFIEQNPHTVVSLLYLDAVVFEPTKIAIEHFVPRMPKGAIIAFDELNSELWPGETIAVARELGLSNLRVRRFPFASFISYAVL